MRPAAWSRSRQVGLGLARGASTTSDHTRPPGRSCCRAQIRASTSSGTLETALLSGRVAHQIICYARDKRIGLIRYFTLQLAESYLTGALFRQILQCIERLAWHPT